MFRSLFRLREFLAKYYAALGTGIFAFLISRVLEAAVPLFLKHGIDSIAGGSADVLWPVLGIIAAVVTRFAVVSQARIIVRRVGLNVAFDLRERLYAQLQHQGARFFSQFTIGDMMTRAIADISLIQRLIAMGTILLVVMVFATAAGFGFMLYLSPKLTALILPPLPFVFFYAWWASREMGVSSRDVQDRMSDLGTHVQENLSGIRTIQAMVQEENEIKRLARTNEQYSEAFYRQAEINSSMAAWMPTLAAACSVVILGYGGSLVLSGDITVGTFTAFFMYVNMVVQPFRMAGFVVNVFQRAAVATDRLFEVFDLAPEIDDAPTGKTPKQIRGAIEFRHLSFAYDATRDPALNDVSLTVARRRIDHDHGPRRRRQDDALKLLVRLLDTPPGTVFVDGHDVREYPLAQLRSQIAMVPQDPFLFGEPLRDNLTYDDPVRALDLDLGSRRIGRFQGNGRRLFAAARYDRRRTRRHTVRRAEAARYARARTDPSGAGVDPR